MKVVDKVKMILAETLGLNQEEIDGGDHIVDTLGADSLDCVEIIMSAEEEFDIDISDDQAERVGTVDQAVTLIEELL